MRKILFAALLGTICISIVFAAMQKQPWIVPEEAKNLKNPIAPTEAGIKAAREIYLDDCAQCHGEFGKGDGSEASMYDPAPANLTDAPHMNSLTDGEIFYKISEGKKPMPAFKKRKTEEERWQLVNLVRTFSQKPGAPAKESSVPAPQAAPASKP